MAGWLIAFSIAPDKTEFNNLKGELELLKTAGLEDHGAGAAYRFINPLLMCGSLPIEFPKIRAAESDVQAAIENAKSRGDITMASVYFRDLNNGPWFGVNEKEPFIPASLLKVPLLISYLHLAASNPDLLQKEIVYGGEPFPVPQNYLYGDTLVKGTAYSITELLKRTIIESDNNAMGLLTEESVMPLDKLERVYYDLGIGSPREKSNYEIDAITYASFFRILYNATYLSRDSSEYALQLMSNSKFSMGLRAGVPERVRLSHKFGERYNATTKERQLHDCGIVYLPGSPYLVCIMTRGKDFNRLESVISEISKRLYEKVSIQALQPIAP